MDERESGQWRGDGSVDISDKASVPRGLDMVRRTVMVESSHLISIVTYPNDFTHLMHNSVKTPHLPSNAYRLDVG